MKLFCFLAPFSLLVCLSYQQSAASPPAPNATTSPIITAEVLEKYQNLTELSYLYIVQLELRASRIEEPFADMEKRLDKLVDMAFVLASYKHRKQAPPMEIPLSGSGYNTKIIKKRQNGELTYISFVTYIGNEPVLGEVVAEDMTLLTVSQISATMRYPLGRIVSDKDIEAESTTKWWFLIAVIGTGVIIILVGWFFLFLFYNTCGYMYGSDEEIYVSHAQPQSGNTKMSFVNDLEPGSGGQGAEQSIALPSDGSNNQGARKPRLNKKTQRSCRTLSEVHVERRIKHERDNIRKAIKEAFHKAVEAKKTEALPPSFGRVTDTDDGDVENAKSVLRSEKKRRHTKIGPITAPNATTTRTTNEQEEEGGETSEISGASSETTISTADEEEFDVSILPKTTLETAKKGKNQKGNDVKSDPESDYGSSLDEGKTKGEEGGEEEHEDVRARPMTAKKQRTALFGGRQIAPINTQPRAWTVYTAGDKAAEFWNDHELQHLPGPSSPSENGMIEIKTSRAFHF